MLKKLIKYGNSHAVVLDRTILALLNIDEGGVVKFRVEGDALIIKAQSVSEPTDAAMLAIEDFHERARMMAGETDPVLPLLDVQLKKCATQSKQIKANPKANKQANDWVPGSSNYKLLEEAYKSLINKYKKDTEVFMTSEWKDRLEALNERFKGDLESEAYLNEFQELRHKICPAMKLMDEEMLKINKQLGVPDLI